MKLKGRRYLIYAVLIILGFSAVQLIFSFYQKEAETSQPLEIVEKDSQESTFIANSEVSPETKISTKTVAEKTDFSRKIISARSPDQADRILETITARGGEIISEKEGLIVARLPKETDKEIENDLNASGLIETLEVDYPTFVVGEAIDWGVERIGAPDVWETTQAAGISVGIVDTGIDYTHPELQNRYIGGYDFVNQDEDPMDDHGHGTHVSGIAASSLNEVGTAGVSPETGIYGLKVLGSDGSGYVSDVVEAVDWAIDNNLQVLNFSIGSTYDSEILEEKLQEAVSNGIISVAAAGNTNGGSLLYPAAYSSVIAVSATDSSDDFASFSSAGAELAAPGVSINSTVPGGGYATWSGTSMSSPHVAATAALMISNQEENIREGLRNTALDLGPTGKDSYYGYGLVQSKPAVLGEDVLDPAVSFLSPENNSEVSGEVEIKLDVQDESAIDKVILYINGEKVKEWPEGEYQYLWDTKNYSEGDYTLVSEAVDEYENKGKAKVEVKVVSEEKTSPTPEPSPELTPTATVTPSPQRFEQGESEPVRKDTEQEQAEEHRRDQENIPETLPTEPVKEEEVIEEEEVEESEENIPEVTNLNQRNPKPTKKVEETTTTNAEAEKGMPEEVKEKAPGLDRGRVRGIKTIPFFVLIDRILSSL